MEEEKSRKFIPALILTSLVGLSLIGTIYRTSYHKPRQKPIQKIQQVSFDYEQVTIGNLFADFQQYQGKGVEFLCDATVIRHVDFEDGIEESNIPEGCKKIFQISYIDEKNKRVLTLDYHSFGDNKSATEFENLLKRLDRNPQVRINGIPTYFWNNPLPFKDQIILESEYLTIHPGTHLQRTFRLGNNRSYILEKVVKNHLSTP